jgi:hypothetical protein
VTVRTLFSVVPATIVVSDGAGPLGKLIGGDGDDVLHGGGGRAVQLESIR